jgi:hypothetical protein
MNYPTIEQVEMADREQIYRWFLCLPLPRTIRMGKGKTATWVKEGGENIIKRIHSRWVELGGSDPELREKILKEITGTIYNSIH